MSRYGIAEWYGEPFMGMPVQRRQELAAVALGNGEHPICPFQHGAVPCRKKGGVCSLQRYEKDETDRVRPQHGSPVIICPHRFKEGDLVVRWLADIVHIDQAQARTAHEVPFMRSTETSRAAGRIDIVLANDDDDNLIWFGLEIQAVYFSGKKMGTEFERLRQDIGQLPPFPR